MFNFNGCVCEKCNEQFNSTSDVVVCPECGSPHHRDCWKDLGHCANQAKHSENFEWKSPEIVVDKDKVMCPKCHTQNPIDLSFCENCGIALQQNNQSAVISPTVEPAKFQQVPPTNVILPKALEGSLENISFKDMAIYIGASAPYYIFKFKRKQTEGNNYKPFCWSAFVFDGFYFLYRKMWLESILILIISMALSVPQLILLYAEQGIISAASPLLFSGISTVATVTGFLSFAFKVFLGFWAVPAYQKKVVKEVNTIKSTTKSDNLYYQVLVSRSGPSKAVLFSGLILMLFYMLI